MLYEVAIYTCPICGQAVYVNEILSYNSFDIGTIYSDLVISMLNNPTETKCKKCGKIFELNEFNNVEKIYDNIFTDYFFSDEEQNKLEKYKSLYEATFLSVQDYLEKIRNEEGDEKQNRLNLWHTANVLFDDKEKNIDTQIYIDNCKWLISLYKKPKNDNQIITLAELYRNIGNFNSCIKTILKLKDDKDDRMKNKFIEHCIKKDKLTFEL
jgi:hypothetical protein